MISSQESEEDSSSAATPMAPPPDQFSGVSIRVSNDIGILIIYKCLTLISSGIFHWSEFRNERTSTALRRTEISCCFSNDICYTEV